MRYGIREIQKPHPSREAKARRMGQQAGKCFGHYFLGGYCLNIFCTDFSVCFSSPFWEFEMLSTVACPRQTRCFWATSYRSTESIPSVRGSWVVTAVSE